METTQEKPRISYAEFMSKRPPTYAPGTIADWIERYVRERSQPGGRQIQSSQRYILRAVQRARIAEKHHTELKAADFLAHCKARVAGGTKPQTVQQDMTYLSGVIKYAFEIWEIPTAEQAYAAYRKARPQLIKEQLISKSQPRDRRPTPEELEKLLAYFSLPPKKAMQNIIPMVPIVKFAYLSGRRISETCRIMWGDVDHEKRLCLVRDLKNSKGKGFHDSFPLLGEAWDIVMAQPRLRPDDPTERIFPYVAKSCGAKFTRAKAVLKIFGVRLHDLRRHCFSGMFEAGFSVPEVQKMSMHRNPTILLKNYTALKPEDLHNGPASKRELRTP